MKYSETVRTRAIKGNYEVRQITEYKNGVAISYKGKFIRQENTIQDARKFLDTVSGD